MMISNIMLVEYEFDKNIVGLLTFTKYYIHESYNFIDILVKWCEKGVYL